jgi:hypothetical protein
VLRQACRDAGARTLAAQNRLYDAVELEYDAQC